MKRSNLNMVSRSQALVICNLIALASTAPAFAGTNELPGTEYLLGAPSPVAAEGKKVAAINEGPHAREAGANVMAVPNPILATGTDLKSGTLSPNAVALAAQLGIMDDLRKLPQLTAQAKSGDVEARLQCVEMRQHIGEILRGAEMDVNYSLAEIYDEQGIYQELLSAYSSERDKALAYTNAVSFGTNGALWAICEALAIPTATRSHFAVSSGIIGILAGIIPSVASGITLKEVNGPKHSAPAAPNMLSKMFNRPTSSQTEFPFTVWSWLDSAPADNSGKKRKDQIIDRWIADSNIPAFTDRNSEKQIDSITASTAQKKTVTLSLLSARLAMLSQLSSEIFKMNRLLTELEMVVRGEKTA